LEAFRPFSRMGTTTNANRGFRRSSLIPQHELEGDGIGVPPTVMRMTATDPGCSLDREETSTLAAHAKLRRRGERGCGRFLWASGMDANQLEPEDPGRSCCGHGGVFFAVRREEGADTHGPLVRERVIR
jgi:hypothetical protein